MLLEHAQLRQSSYKQKRIERRRIVCGCLDVREYDIRSALRVGLRTTDDVSRACGAGTHCGACLHWVTSIVGNPGGVPARIVSRRWLSPDLVQVRFDCREEQSFLPFAPGQYLRLSILSDAGWVTRPYTITSDSSEDAIREVIVRVLPGGALSSLLGANVVPDEIRIGAPSGEGFRHSSAREGLVFLVGGVGMTPAISALRPHLREGGVAVKGVCASFARRAPGAVRLLRRLCAEADVPLKVQRTDKVGFVSREDIDTLVKSHHRGVQWFLCGPQGFRETMREHLDKAGVWASRIHQEKFTPSIQPNTLPAARERTSPETRYFWLGCALVAGWCAQALLLPTFSKLVALQSEDTWRIGTGLALLLLIASQWILPLARARGSFASKGWERGHRIGGALSPILLFLHSRVLGYGVLGVLTFVFLFNTVLGLFDKTIVRNPARRETWMRLWLPAHIVVAMATTSLVFWHLYLVVAFRGPN